MNKKFTQTTIALAACLSISTAAVTSASATTSSAPSITSNSMQPMGSTIEKNSNASTVPEEEDQDADGSTKQDTINSPAGQLVLLFASIVSLILAVVPLITPYLPALQNIFPR